WLSVAVQYPATSALHQEGSSGDVPALQAVAHPAIHIAFSSPLGDEAHVECHRATNTKRLLKPPLPLSGMEMLSQGIARGIIEDQPGLAQAANAGDPHGMAIDRGGVACNRTVDLIVERMVHHTHEGAVRGGQGDGDTG